MTAWILTIVFVVSAGWSFTGVLGLTCPHLTPWQRWYVVWMLIATAGAIHLAWRAGA